MVNPNIFREVTSRVTMMADSIKVAPPTHTATRETLRNLAWMAANMDLRLQAGSVAVRKAAASRTAFSELAGLNPAAYSDAVMPTILPIVAFHSAAHFAPQRLAQRFRTMFSTISSSMA